MAQIFSTSQRQSIQFNQTLQLYISSTKIQQIQWISAWPNLWISCLFTYFGRYREIVNIRMKYEIFGNCRFTKYWFEMTYCWCDRIRRRAKTLRRSLAKKSGAFNMHDNFPALIEHFTFNFNNPNIAAIGWRFCPQNTASLLSLTSFRRI